MVHESEKLPDFNLDKLGVVSDSPSSSQGQSLPDISRKGGVLAAKKKKGSRFPCLAIGKQLLITGAPLLVFVAIFTLWFSITSPAPSRRIGSSMFILDSGGHATHTLASAVGASPSDFDIFPSTDLGLWIGAMGACARTTGPLVCEKASLDPDYTASVLYLNATLPIAGDLIELINSVPSAVRAIPVVSSTVFVVSFILTLFGLAGIFVGNAVHYGSENHAAGRWINRLPGLWPLKSWLTTKKRGRWILCAGGGCLSLGWILGFTAGVSFAAQWGGTAKLANEAYAGFLANSTTADPLPPLLAARLGPAIAEQFVAWGTILFATFFTFISAAEFPDVLEPLAHGQGGGYGSEAASGWGGANHYAMRPTGGGLGFAGGKGGFGGVV